MRRVGIFSELPLRREEFEIASEVRLWRAVLDQMLQDYVGPIIEGKSEVIRAQANQWLRGDSRDFEDVCLLACVEPEDAHQIIRREMNGADNKHRR